MTLILSLVTPSVVVQLSDRRVSFLRGGRVEARDDLTNKAVVYCGRVAFSYTGVAEVRGQRTDKWIANVLSEAALLPKGFELLRKRGTAAFRGAGLPLSIVAAGWTFRPPDGHLAPFYSIVSNSFANGRWLREPMDRFVWVIEVAPERRFGLFIAGRTVPSNDRRSLHRNLKRVSHRGLHVSNAIRLMADTVRSRARFDRAVGEDLLINCIPKAAVSSSSSRQVTLISGSPLPDVPTFLYMPAARDEPIVHGPTFVCHGAVMSDFQAGPL